MCEPLEDWDNCPNMFAITDQMVTSINIIFKKKHGKLQAYKEENNSDIISLLSINKR